jgi:hypothetical protein
VQSPGLHKGPRHGPAYLTVFPGLTRDPAFVAPIKSWQIEYPFAPSCLRVKSARLIG